MGKILDSILCFKDALAGGGFESLAAASGDSLALRWFGEGTRCDLLDVWGGNNVSKMDVSIRSPLLHDNTRGIRFAHMFNPTQSGADGNPNLYLPPYWKQPLQPTDTLTVEVSGTAADDATVCLSLLYEAPNYQGARLLSVSEVEQRLENIVGIRVSPAPPGATSTWGTAEAINSDDDRLKANTDYALLGLTTDLPFTALKLFGPDTGNYGIPIPGYRDENITAGWFYDMARRWNMPMIPVINANNKGVTQTALADVGGGTAPLISLQFAELR
jgi:hypothetical protein